MPASTPSPRPPLRLDDLRPGRFLAHAARAAIFDFDGTLAASGGVWGRVERTFLERRGIPHDAGFDERLAAMGFEDRALHTIGHYGLDDTVQQVCDEWNALGRELYATEVRLRPGAEAYVRALRSAGVPVALATTNDPDVLAATEPRTHVLELFDVRVHGRDVAHHTKEHPDIYLEVARRLGVAPRDCLVFEDVLPAVRTARDAGMRAVGVRTDSPRQPWDDIRREADLAVEGWEGLA